MQNVRFCLLPQPQAAVRRESVRAQDHPLLRERQTSESADRLGHVGQQGYPMLPTAVPERLSDDDNATESAGLRATGVQEVSHVIAEVESDLPVLPLLLALTDICPCDGHTASRFNLKLLQGCKERQVDLFSNF